MSIVVQTAINRILQQFSTEYLKYIDQSPAVADLYSMEIPSSSRSTLHAWIANQAVVREWLGARIARSMGTQSWEVVNRNWELTYEFEVNQIADDLSGLAALAVMNARDGVIKWQRHKDLLVAQTLEAGSSKLCFDGQYFFSASHPVDPEGVTSGTYSNLLTSSALTHSTFNTALTQLRQFKNVDGSPMIPVGAPIRLMVPPALRLKADQILVAQSLTPAAAIGLYGTSGASDNMLRGKAEVLENPYLSSDTTWYLVAQVGIMKPLMFQNRQPVEFVEQGYGSPIYFQEKKIQIAMDARYEVSYTLPQLCIKATA